MLEMMFLCPESFYGLLVPNTYLPNVPLAIYAAPFEKNLPIVKEQIVSLIYVILALLVYFLFSFKCKPPFLSKHKVIFKAMFSILS